MLYKTTSRKKSKLHVYVMARAGVLLPLGRTSSLAVTPVFHQLHQDPVSEDQWRPPLHAWESATDSWYSWWLPAARDYLVLLRFLIFLLVVLCYLLVTSLHYSPVCPPVTSKQWVPTSPPPHFPLPERNTTHCQVYLDEWKSYISQNLPELFCSDPYFISAQYLCFVFSHSK